MTFNSEARRAGPHEGRLTVDLNVRHSRRRVRQRDVRVRRFGQRQVDEHDGADAFLALDAQGAAVELGERAGDGEAEA